MTDINFYQEKYYECQEAEPNPAPGVQSAGKHQDQKSDYHWLHVSYGFLTSLENCSEVPGFFTPKALSSTFV